MTMKNVKNIKDVFLHIMNKMSILLILLLSYRLDWIAFTDVIEDLK